MHTAEEETTAAVALMAAATLVVARPATTHAAAGLTVPVSATLVGETASRRLNGQREDGGQQ